MQQQRDGAPVVEQAFLEYHFYSGGLRTEAFALSGARPAWAPPAEWVGFRDEFALEAGDRVVEVVKFKSEPHVVAWIGVYQPAPDKVYGDRKNHAGFGVWLLNGYPKEPALLVDALQSLLGIGQADDGARTSKKAQEFLGEYLVDYVDPYEALPRPFGGLAFAESQLASTHVRRIDTRHEAVEHQLDDLVRRLFFYLPEAQSDNARALLLLTASDRSREMADAGKEQGELVPELLRQLPQAMRALSERVIALEGDLAKERATLEELDGKRDLLEVDLMAARSRANDSEAQLRDLRASLAEDDERKRFSILQSGISGVNSNIENLQRQFGSLKQEIVNEVRRSSAKAAASPSLGNEFRQRTVPSDNFVPTRHHRKDFSDLWLYGGIVVFLVTLVGAIVWYFAFR